MENNNAKHFKGVILVLGLLISLILCSGASAADVNGVSHYNSKLSTVKDLKTVNTTTSSVKKYSYSKSSNSIPAYYDLRNLGRVTPVKNQGFSSTCWAFATYGSLESCLLPKEKWNFSEHHMQDLLSDTYPWGFDRSYDGAGCWEMATAYLTRYSGPVTAAMDPFNDFNGNSPSNIQPVKHVQETIIIQARNSTGKINNFQLKNAVMKYGGIYTLMMYSDLNFNPLTNSYYYGGPTTDYNHAVCIVGWDDNYSKNNFIGGAPANGAFIVKNSWGSDWGDKGFFYVSYYDKLFANSDDNVVFMNAEPTTNYDNIYQYDPFGYVGRYGFNSDIAWFSNIFTANGNEMLKAASFYVLKPNAAYNLYVYVDPKGNDPASGTLATIKRGVISSAGYKTIQLHGLIPLVKGHKFSIVLKLTVPNLNDPITIEYPLEYYSSKATAKYGESYISRNGIVWIDMTSLVPNANVCLKAFTIGKKTDLSITKNLSSGHGSIATFTIKVKNNGPGRALNVFVKDKLQDGLTFLAYKSSQGNYNAITGLWYIGTLEKGAVVTMILKCMILGSGHFSNLALVNSSTFDPDLNNNVAEANSESEDHANPIKNNANMIPMKKTGIPIIPMVAALLLVTIVFVSKKR